LLTVREEALNKSKCGLVTLIPEVLIPHILFNLKRFIFFNKTGKNSLKIASD